MHAKSKGLIFAACLLLALNAGSPQFGGRFARAETAHAGINAEDWKSINHAADMVDADVSDFLVTVFHQGEACAIGDMSCLVPLSKRTEDFHLIIKGWDDFVDQEMIDVVREELVETIYDFKVRSGISALLTPPVDSGTFVYLVFVNEDVYQAHPALYLRARITRESFGLQAERREKFENFITRSYPCMNTVGVYPDGVLRDAHVWIRVDLKPQEMRSCTRTQIAGALGVHFNFYSRANELFFARYPRLTKQTEVAVLNALVKVLYDARMSPNASEVATRALANRLTSDFDM